VGASADSAVPRAARWAPDANDPGLLTPAQTSLLTDQYELAMASSYLGRGMNEPAVFELFVRHLPARRRWLLAAGVGPALALVREMQFGALELAYLASLGFGGAFLEYLARYRFTSDIDAMPEGTIVFAREPLVRVTAPRVEAQLLETLLLNQINSIRSGKPATNCGTSANRRSSKSSHRSSAVTASVGVKARRRGELAEERIDALGRHR